MSQSSADNPYTHETAAFVAGLTFEAIPAAVRQRIKLLMLDAFGGGIRSREIVAATQSPDILERDFRGGDSDRQFAGGVRGADQERVRAYRESHPDVGRAVRALAAARGRLYITRNRLIR